jgi:hypothetical protein
MTPMYAPVVFITYQSFLNRPSCLFQKCSRRSVNTELNGRGSSRTPRERQERYCWTSNRSLGRSTLACSRRTPRVLHVPHVLQSNCHYDVVCWQIFIIFCLLIQFPHTLTALMRYNNPDGITWMLQMTTIRQLGRPGLNMHWVHPTLQPHPLAGVGASIFIWPELINFEPISN